MKSDIIHKNQLNIRNGVPDDHGKILSVMKKWWGGRDLTDLLLKIFFIHFRNTVFIAEKDDKILGFFIGYFIPASHKEAYIHLIGTDPNVRKIGIGRLLFERFFEHCKKQNRTVIRSCTSPINELSIEFHKQMGFLLEPGDGEINGYPVTPDYLGRNAHMVLFIKELE